MTKVQLVKENATLEAENKNLKTQKEESRISICKVLGFVRTERTYGMASEKVTDLSWPEIYSEIGRLRELARQKDQSERLRYFEELINRHEKQLNETETL